MLLEDFLTADCEQGVPDGEDSSQMWNQWKNGKWNEENKWDKNCNGTMTVMMLECSLIISYMFFESLFLFMNVIA